MHRIAPPTKVYSVGRIASPDSEAADAQAGQQAHYREPQVLHADSKY